jgi:hypothetical protein
MRSLLWKLSISELDTLEEKLKCEKDIDNLCIEGIQKLIYCLDAFLDDESNISENEDINLKIYASGTLTNGEIVYATSRFYGQPKFSDVAVAMDSNDTDYLTDNGMCYGKVSYIKIYFFFEFCYIFINKNINLDFNISRNYIIFKNLTNCFNTLV